LDTILSQFKPVLMIVVLLNDYIPTAYVKTSNGMMVMNNELGRMSKEAVVDYFKVLYYPVNVFSRKTGLQRLELGTSQMRSSSAEC
jgi:hypothetical protein